MTSEVTGSGGQGQKALHEEPLDAILNPELDKMVTDGEFKLLRFQLALEVFRRLQHLDI